MEEQSTQASIFVITGPESTGKTELTKALAHHFGFKWEPELARDYVQNLKGNYMYADVEAIAKKQIVQFEEAIASGINYFFDTGLIITKVWFDVVYKKCPDWFEQAIRQLPKFIHLLCSTDLPWQSDNVRENGGEMREKLFKIYQMELDYYGFKYHIVKGSGVERTKNAIDIVNAYL